jgi:hypothetical protein
MSIEEMLEYLPGIAVKFKYAYFITNTNNFSHHFGTPCYVIPHVLEMQK